MIKIHDFGIGLVEYGERGKKNDFPLFDECPNCKCLAHGNLHRNGYYWRYGITEEETSYIPICRLRCLGCKVNISILPDFLIPYFQHTVKTVLDRVNQILQNKRVNGSRQLLRFYLCRYLKCINWIHTFFISLGEISGKSGDIKKEAIKYMKMIHDFGESPFLRRSQGHLAKYLMAN
ncbi:DUF6431 domain-containing protein [Anaerobacillus isosaccharinicus]|uniref:DUF6431 domain-containing protein n=1 Tax=Anaerobacillus isosaccharinicus TaxID=1532552 RepID=A0A1S2L519_9BACI|nr:DUF6431 domain-containing protein [Anaerobacillus isosaccharinicus]MBA5583970.1 hypothetical protein [Anaerobacillus isosaccharinicus]MBA5584708.1 hypothetical protein [Anaerobacillus isosaccharinicus]MBA5585242.1 hypothetical protein [Anaerobacillus isosaccharinicus]MBA5586301.1 hypothetical protein [Anaerobacillus isosaccharinicus]MBA5586338.1 hypothetical protein [Anaerobacillus isosaccharinicus]